MRGLVFIFLLLHASGFGFVKKTSGSDFETLNQELSKQKIYDQQKNQVIKNLKLNLSETSAANLQKQFKLCEQLYDQYKSYQYDSAYKYTNKLQHLSLQLKDKNKEADSKVKTGFILLSAGMFKEAFEVLRTIYIRNLSDSIKFEYYALQSRANYDLAAFNHDLNYTPYYNRLANRYLDSAIAVSQPGSYENIYYKNYQKFKNGDYLTAEKGFINLLKNPALTPHQTAIITSTLSNVYMANHEEQKSETMLIDAVIKDIQTSTKETVALFWLAEKLYKKGDVKNAYLYIQQAMSDAEFYGARQRQVQISTVLPIIAAQNLQLLEKEKTRFLIYLLSTTVLSLLVILASISLFKQLKNLKIKEKIIADQNDALKIINQKMEDDTHIKEEYIGYFFDLISGYILKLEKLKRSVDMKLSVKKYDDIPAIIHSIQIKKEREILFRTFDQVFLKIFPHFVTSFNALFKPGDQIWPKEHEVLTTDLRIFALIRLGITDNETIAKILEYSEKTIYVYKMRIKAKSLVHGEEFEQRIMAIRAGAAA